MVVAVAAAAVMVVVVVVVVVMVRAYMPPEGKFIKDIEIALMLLEKANHDR